ncbi:MAG: hypothetical protein C0467_04650 [Planctomycetaceae bacterium]|nr:hypothetical protein [Planctomycetaceae bacterium]
MPFPDLTAQLESLLARLATLPRGERVAFVYQILPLLADPRISLSIRITAAARVLQSIPDRRRPVRRVARALSAGVSSNRALERLRQVQNQIEACSALDDLIDAREQRVKMACPRCKIRLPRIEMVKHLWHEHRLTLHRRKTRTTSRTAADLQLAYATTGDPAALDRIAELYGPAGLRRWMAELKGPPEELAPLLASAAEHGAGLCPACFAELPAAVTAMPTPLELANGRLSGEGYAVQLGGNAWVRTCAVSGPGQPTERSGLAPTARLSATVVGSCVVLAVLLFASSRPITLAGLVVGAIAYLAVRFAWRERDLDDEAVDVAWKQVFPAFVERDGAAGYLSRLCLTSLGRGTPEQRVELLTFIVASAASRADESDAELQLLATASVLQIEDSRRFGRDAVAGIAALAAIGFTGQLSADFAEFVVAAYLKQNREEGELNRLRVLLFATAFEAGLVPRDLRTLWAAAPNLKRAMSAESAPRLRLLFGLWQTREAQAWHAVGHGDTVFDIARKLPRDAASTLARFPDLLLSHRPERAVEDLIGPVLICVRGVAVAGQLVADPDAEVRLEADGRVLAFGRHRIEAREPLPNDFPVVVRRWLQFHAEWLTTLDEGHSATGTPAVAERVLAPFCQRCGECGVISAVGCGEVGRRVTTY